MVTPANGAVILVRFPFSDLFNTKLRPAVVLAYCVAKASLAMMTKLFAARLAEFGINVYEIQPGVIATI